MALFYFKRTLSFVDIKIKFSRLALNREESCPPIDDMC